MSFSIMTSGRRRLIGQLHLLYLILILVALTLVSLAEIDQNKSAKQHTFGSKKEINRKSIVFDIKTPKVFYCQQERQYDATKMIVKAKPLEKLCEFGGKQKPKSSPSDCYNDVDETGFACEEKKRFLVRLEIGDIDPASAFAVPTLADTPEEFDLSESRSKSTHKKVDFDKKIKLTL